MSLKDVDYFPPGKEEWFGKSLLEENIQLKDVMDRGRIRPIQELKRRRDKIIINPWRYNQLKHFIESLLQPTIKNLLPLEKICMDADEKGVFSRIYKILVELRRPDIPAFIGKWEKELGKTLLVTEVSMILKRVSATSVNSNLLELNFKCLTRMYMTPDRMHKIHGEKSQLCWRGCNEIGTMAHMWWLCPEMGIFWDEIRIYIQEITQFDLPKDPGIFLFHLSDMPTKT